MLPVLIPHAAAFRPDPSVVLHPATRWADTMEDALLSLGRKGLRTILPFGSRMGWRSLSNEG